MNDQIQEYARSTLKAGLAKCTDRQRRLFVQMYGTNGGRRSVDEAASMPINDIVDEMPPDKLDWAMEQVRRTLIKAGEAGGAA